MQGRYAPGLDSVPLPITKSLEDAPWATGSTSGGPGSQETLSPPTFPVCVWVHINNLLFLESNF